MKNILPILNGLQWDTSWTSFHCVCPHDTVYQTRFYLHHILVRFIPSWFPGARFKRDAQKWGQHAAGLRKMLAEGVERRMVRTLYLPRDRNADDLERRLPKKAGRATSQLNLRTFKGWSLTRAKTSARTCKQCSTAALVSIKVLPKPIAFAYIPP